MQRNMLRLNTGFLTENIEANCQPGNTFEQEKQNTYDTNVFEPGKVFVIWCVK